MGEVIHVDFGAEVKEGDEIELPEKPGLYKVLAVNIDGTIEIEQIKDTDATLL